VIVTYAPDGQEPQRWDWDPTKVRAVEAELIEKRFNGTWDSFRMAVLEGSVRARRVLLWHLLKRQHPILRLGDVDYGLGELTVEMTRAELMEFRGAVVKAKGITDEEREKALRALDAEIESAPEVVDVGKVS